MSGDEGNAIDVEATITDREANRLVRKQSTRPTNGRKFLGHVHLRLFIARLSLDIGKSVVRILEPCNVADMKMLLGITEGPAFSIELVRVEEENIGHWVMVIHDKSAGKIYIWEPSDNSHMSQVVADHLTAEGSAPVDIVLSGEQKDNFSCGYIVLWWLTKVTLTLLSESSNLLDFDPSTVFDYPVDAQAVAWRKLVLLISEAESNNTDQKTVVWLQNKLSTRSTDLEVVARTLEECALMTVVSLDYLDLDEVPVELESLKGLELGEQLTREVLIGSLLELFGVLTKGLSRLVTSSRFLTRFVTKPECQNFVARTWCLRTGRTTAVSARESLPSGNHKKTSL